MKKQNKILNKILSMFFIVVMLCSCFITPAYAEDYINPEDMNTIPLPSGTGSENVVMQIPLGQRSIDNLAFLFEYVEWIYSYNMTNSQPLLAIRIDNIGRVVCYFAAVNSDVEYVSMTLAENESRLTMAFYNADDVTTPGHQVAYLCGFGNLMFETTNGTTKSFYVSSNVTEIRNSAYMYRDEAGFLTYHIGTNIVAENPSANVLDGTGVYFDLVDIYSRMRYFIENSYGGALPPVETGAVLDIGSIITAVMTAPMTVFGGLTGTPGDLSQSLNLFGIDIRAAIISMLVIAIVVFIIKFLRGG